MSADEWEKLWFAVFGSALTIVVTVINGSAARWLRAQSVKRGMFAEMYELRYRVAATIWLMGQHLGQLDEALLNEISTIVGLYKGPEDNTVFKDLLELMREVPAEMRQRVLDGVSKPERGVFFVAIHTQHRFLPPI